MASLAPLTEAEVKRLIDHWFFMLDVHAIVLDVLPLLADVDLQMRFPEGTLHGQEEFIPWYERVTRTFFDEIHVMQQCRIVPSKDGSWADADIVVKWLAKRWQPPSAKSEWLGFDSNQHWTVVRSPQTQKPVIKIYTVNALVPLEGSVAL